MFVPLTSRFLQLSEEEFFLFTQEMKHVRVEREADGTITLRDIAGSESDSVELEVGSELIHWNNIFGSIERMARSKR